MITFPSATSALVVLPVPADETGVARILGLERDVLDALPGVQETIPAFNKLLIEGIPEHWDPEAVEHELRRLIEVSFREEVEVEARTEVVLPACYDVSLAPDLPELARHAGLTAAQVAEIHSSATYTVLATGFAPGFAYLGSIDPRIAMPRRVEPRQRVEAGSLAIADRRTGVYPAAGPGGWRLIGRVPRALFDDVAERVSRFEPGMSVSFRPISRDDFEREDS